CAPGVCGSPAASSGDGHHYLKMSGHEVFKVAVAIMCEATRQTVAAAGVGIDDIDLFVPHQANERIIKAAARNLGLPDEKVFLNVERYGNTSAASIPIALCEAVEQGRLREGTDVMLVGFGAGLTWAAMLLRWGGGV
ncbi:MAG: 3-oxoacyl-[acyl-carrier-protein] synthase III C-terminal domain-containing protein, partial [Chloroflexota bacterium]